MGRMKMLIMHKPEHHINPCLTQIPNAGSSVCWTDLPSTDSAAAKARAPMQVFFPLHFSHMFHKKWWDHNHPRNDTQLIRIFSPSVAPVYTACFCKMQKSGLGLAFLTPSPAPWVLSRDVQLALEHRAQQRHILGQAHVFLLHSHSVWFSALL